jgi:hypothetical protein
MKSKLLYFFSVFILLVLTIEAKTQDTKSVTGIVTSFKQIPLKKAKITSSESGRSVYTDSLGRFGIQISDKDALVITADGFENKKIKITKKSIYIIDLTYKDNVTNFNNAVNNGHISEDILRKSINSAQVRNVKDYSKYASIYELIATEIYNVKVSNNVVYNKTVRSFDQNPKVLYVVDNKIVPDISFVSPIYVKSIEFVDDVGATMWGSMGANGVLIITLK